MAILGPIEARSYDQAGNNPAIQDTSLLQRVESLQEVVHEQARNSAEFQRQVQLLSDRANRSSAALSAAISRVPETERKSRELVVESSELNPPKIPEPTPVNASKKEPETVFEWLGEKICDLGSCIFGAIKAFMSWITCNLIKNQKP
jgi:hypothetical protein